jgi:hypothetical protein
MLFIVTCLREKGYSPERGRIPNWDDFSTTESTEVTEPIMKEKPKKVKGAALRSFALLPFAFLCALRVLRGDILFAPNQE